MAGCVGLVGRLSQILVALVLLSFVAGATQATGSAPAPLPGAWPAPDAACDVAYRSPPGPREPHPPVRIDGDDINEQPTLLPVDRPDPSAYRPGSGIVAGNGSEANPYLIAGWRLARVTIEDTEAHVVVADNAFEPLLEPTGRAVDPDRGLTSLLPPTDSTGPGESHIENAPNVTFLDNDGRGTIRVGDSPGFCYGGNAISDWAGEPSLALCRSDGASVVDNHLHGLDVRRTAHVRVAGNAFVDRGMDLREGFPCRHPSDWPRHRTGPENFDHEIPPTNTLDGEPVRYVHETADVTLTEPLAQVVVHDARNVTVRDASLGPIDVGYARDVAFRNVSLGADRVQALETPAFAFENSTLNGTGVHLTETPNATVAHNRGPGGVALHYANGSRVHGNRLEADITFLLTVGSSLNVSVTENRLREAGFEARDTRSLRVDGNTIRTGGTGIGAFGRNSTITDNRVYGAGHGIATAGTATVSHNLVDGGEHGGSRGIVTFGGAEDGFRVEDNVVWNYTEGVLVNFVPTVASLEGNNFGVGVERGVDEDDPGSHGPLDATENWWGCPEGPPAEGCAGVEGDVIVDPVLTEPNPAAGPRT